MTAEQAALVQKAHESIQAAQLLASQGFGDFAISRAYYAMFYVAQALLLDENLSYSSHSAVIANFGRVFVRAGRLAPHLHRYLIDAQTMRHIGDYGTGPNPTSSDVESLIARAIEFVTVGEDLLIQRPSPARQSKNP